MKRSNIILFVVLGLMLIPWLGESLFNSKGEPREAIVAVSMLDSGNWILPESYGQDIPYKPPMLAWLISICSLLLNGGLAPAVGSGGNYAADRRLQTVAYTL